MNILQVSHSFYPCYQAGGVVKVVYDISRALVKRGHHVTVVTTDGCPQRLTVKKNTEVEVERIRVWYFRNISNYLRIKFKFATPYLLPFFMRKQIRNFDIIHIHEHRTILAVITHYYAMKNKIPYIVQTHGDLAPSANMPIIRRIFDYLWGKKILQDAKTVLALTTTEYIHVQKRGITQDRISLLPNGINWQDFSNLNPPNQFREEYNIPKDTKIIVYLGRIHESKGIDLLITAFETVQQRFNNVILVISGPDEGYEKQLKSLIQKIKIEKKIVFTGPINNTMKMALLQDAEVFVTPKFSGFPLTFLEAGACGTPVITTNNGDDLGWIHDKAGYVTNYTSHELSDAILTIMTNKNIRERMSENGRDTVKNTYTWDKIIPQLEQIYISSLNV